MSLPKNCTLLDPRYLALEEKAESKSEYFDGVIIPIAGGTTNHNRIVGNLYVH